MNYFKNPIKFFVSISLFVTFTSFTLVSGFLDKDEDTLPDWSQMSPYIDGYEGTRTLEFYEFLKSTPGMPERQEVIVAVIDSGFDIEHPALKDNIWINEAEVNGIEGIDDDGNGYIDDYHGWNFLGNAKYLNLEVTRELKRLKKERTPLNDEYFMRVMEYYEDEKSDTENTLELLESIEGTIDKAITTLKEGGFNMEFSKLREQIELMDGKYKAAAVTLLTMESLFGVKPDQIVQLKDEYKIKINVLFDTTDTHILIGDDPKILDEKGYGNNVLLLSENESHGTHVAGTIASSIPGIGQATFAKLMFLRAVPNEGDERDKDISNAIRYAVDNGASIINMSAGKYFSANPEFVSDAITYANENGVLFVVSAGNEGLDLSEVQNFPRKYFVENEEIKTLPNVIVVGASSWMQTWDKSKDPDNLTMGFDLAASFSNYSKDVVDIFAPGVEINSSIPYEKFERLSGTSMSSPQVAGIVAIIKAYYPELTPNEIKKVVKTSARRYPGLEVRLRNSNQLVDFSTLSISGGVIDVVNIFESLLMRQN